MSIDEALLARATVLSMDAVMAASQPDTSLIERCQTRPPRCAVCGRDAHRSGWQGHEYRAPLPEPEPDQIAQWETDGGA